MVITLFFLRLERQTSSALEDDGIGHGHLHNSPLRKEEGGHGHHPLLPGSRRADLLFSTTYSMTTSATL